MMMKKIEKNNNDYELKDFGLFIADYSSSLLSYGSTTVRIEKNIERIGERFGIKIDLTVLPMHVVITILDKNNKVYNVTKKIIPTGIDFNKITLLSKLSWNIHDQKLPLKESQERLEAIKTKERLNPNLVLLLTGLANASFCKLFNGDLLAMMIVFIATINGFYIKNKLHHCFHLDMRICIIISGFVASLIGASGYIFNISSTPEIALGTSVLFLIPGIPFINSISDLIYGHYICFLSRFIQSLIITICLSLGLCLGLLSVNIRFL